MKRKIKNLLLLTSLLALSACAKNTENNTIKTQDTKAASEKDTITTAINEDIQTIDVHKTSKDYMVPLNIFDRLVEVKVEEDGSTKIEPSLAENWEISKDSLTYTLQLKKGIKFHNGEDFTAEDVVFSLNRLVAGEGAVNGDFVSGILGYDELVSGRADSMSGIKIIDDYTVEISLKEPYAGFMACLSASPVCMLDKTTVEKAGDKFGIEPEYTVGTGAFKLASWKTNEAIELVANKEYWAGAPEIEKVKIVVIPDTETQNMMFKNGELDILDMDYMIEYISEYKEKNADLLISTPRVGITYFTFNENIQPLGDVKVRKALSMAIDRKQIVDSMYTGIASVENGIFPRGLIGYNPELTDIEYNPQKAKELLEEAGYADGFDMEISADSSASDTINSVLEIMSEQLSLIGVNASVKSYDQATWLATRKAGDLGSFMSTWTADYNDPDNFIYTFFGSKENTKLRSLNYYDEEIIKRVAKAKVIVDADERLKEYKKLEEKIVSEDAAWLPMFSREHYFAVAKDVSGFVPNWAGISDIKFFGIKKN